MEEQADATEMRPPTPEGWLAVAASGGATWLLPQSVQDAPISDEGGDAPDKADEVPTGAEERVSNDVDRSETIMMDEPAWLKDADAAVRVHRETSADEPPPLEPLSLEPVETLRPSDDSHPRTEVAGEAASKLPSTVRSGKSFTVWSYHLTPRRLGVAWKALVVLLLLCLIGLNLRQPAVDTSHQSASTELHIALQALVRAQDERTSAEALCAATQADLEGALQRSDAALSEAREKLDETLASLRQVSEEREDALREAEAAGRREKSCEARHKDTTRNAQRSIASEERSEMLREARAVVEASEKARKQEREAWQRRLRAREEDVEALRLALRQAKKDEAAAERARKQEREAWQRRLHDEAETRARQAAGQGRKHEGGGRPTDPRHRRRQSQQYFPFHSSFPNFPSSPFRSSCSWFS